MPHLVTSRPRASSSQNSSSWDRVSAWIYRIGGVLFIVGSVAFFPKLHHYQDLGIWLFIIGSLLYLIVTGYDAIEARRYWQRHKTHTKADIIERVASVNYLIGSILFTIGSIGFLSEATRSIGAWCFVIGSIAFIIAGCANLLQLPSSPSLTYLQLFNFTLVCFIVGSTLFVFATLPYLQHYMATIDLRHINNITASMFTVGSILFWWGGEMIYWRYFVTKRLTGHSEPSRFGHNFIKSIRNEVAAEADQKQARS